VTTATLAWRTDGLSDMAPIGPFDWLAKVFKSHHFY
jgi:hypothetical protein